MAFILLFGLTFLSGAILYPRYRAEVRPPLEKAQSSAPQWFDLKEHWLALSLPLAAAHLVLNLSGRRDKNLLLLYVPLSLVLALMGLFAMAVGYGIVDQGRIP